MPDYPEPMTADPFSTDVDQLVTGEAVALELPPASVGIRLASGLIDVAIQVVLLIAGLIGAAVGCPDEALGAVGAIVVVALVIVLGPATLETLTMGRTVGKLVLGTRTVRDDAGPISFHHAFVRHLVAIVEIWVFYGVPALISSLVSSKGKRLGDYAAGTYVVRDRFKLQLPWPAADAAVPRRLGTGRRHRTAAGLGGRRDPAAARPDRHAQPTRP